MFCCFSAGLGELYVWGKNVRGCLGIGRPDDQYFPWHVSTGLSVKGVALWCERHYTAFTILIQFLKVRLKVAPEKCKLIHSNVGEHCFLTVFYQVNYCCLRECSEKLNLVSN